MADNIATLYLFENGTTTELVADALSYCTDRDEEHQRLGDENAVARKLVETDASHRGHLGAFEYSLSVGDADILDMNVDSALRLVVDELYFRTRLEDVQEDDVLAAAEDLYDFAGDLYEHLVDGGYRANYVCGLGPGELMTASQTGSSLSLERIDEGLVDEFYWLQILPPSVVDTIGRESVLSMPAWRVSELSDGAVEFGLGPVPTFDGNVVSDQPLVYDEDAVRDHVGYGEST